MNVENTLHLPTLQRQTWYAPPRVDIPELLDEGYGTPGEVARSLADLWRVNRWLGGLMELKLHLRPFIDPHAATFTLVDVGAGSGQVAGNVAAWARTINPATRVVAVDFSRRHLDIAKTFTQDEAGVSLLTADANRMPFAPGSVDVVYSSLFLHHFTPDQIVRLLNSAFRAARRGVVMSDLIRGHLPLLGWKVAMPVLARSSITKHDGEASVRRAYLPVEMREMAAAAGLTNVKLHAPLPFRMVLVAKP